MVTEKLGVRAFEGKASNVPPPMMTSLTGEVAFEYSNYNRRYVIGTGVLEFETMWTQASNSSIHVTTILLLLMVLLYVEESISLYCTLTGTQS